MYRSLIGLTLGVLLVLVPTAARAQDDDAALKPAEPDFTLITLPTSLNAPVGKMAFRVTHRFARPLDCDTCVNTLGGDAFGIDNGAQIGLELRAGVVKNGQVGVYRVSDKTLNVFGQYGLTRQTGSMPIETAVRVGVDMTNVGQRHTDSEYSPAIALILGRLIGDQAALYVEPSWVHHSNVFRLPGDDNTVMIGLGARVRVLPTLYLTGEFSPRVGGYKPGHHPGSFSLEKRVGGHMFQINFSNGLGTTPGQLARGGPSQNEWHLGFNITRKFF